MSESAADKRLKVTSASVRGSKSAFSIIATLGKDAKQMCAVVVFKQLDDCRKLR